MSRVDINTTNEDFADYVLKAGMKDVVCRKLKSKDDKQYKTAAVFVHCSVESRDIFYDGSCWPDSVEIRDWVFHN